MDNSIEREINEFLNNVKFKRKFFGGVDEVDVLKKISLLNTLYTKAVEAERTRYNTILEDKFNLISDNEKK